MATIHQTALVDPSASIADDVEIGPFCQVGPNVVLDKGVKLLGNVVLTGNTHLGENTVVHPFAVLGGPPQHLGYKGEDTKLIIGRNNTVREHVTMNPGTVSGRGQTVIGDNCLFMAATHVAHDCIVGNNVIMANNATLGGHVIVSDFVFMGGLSAVHQYCRVGIYSFVGAAALVTMDVIPYGSVIGNHARLEGLNIVGMKRRGTSRQVIHDIRAAYRLLFAREGTLQERIEDVTAMFAHSQEVMTIIEFMKADSSRALCTPKG
ncbi:acyl-ACP--UDP-N-acetylglucosamine O-acyltransferase [Aquisalinus flavus]|uniref:Acyl-[acyl-carrier-protein]--UDP-N-acetylglucosamine O-acyltransferase n=1 Tax=Aquisalinus flavus TaxID=1526572 RepID=A0A8J2V542_9PROT|nr:acyl-ACP--UDP-N-acetylglucosamine O-acyltransferase [Aquisalinus flavus]MBD0427805.1 acyl-ACP--UDP-N-acetylglucosamine O-acyltransferase [Aquisalinus flavus]UNE47578.1 acyl-ACP--UDP-N-acetylglucosamine O-acyltransferase [Aquisalinus flavus]GGD03943.1 acyl-[acyl-carrier-protein]--UDP-N-acetylglucosamine O-acyltransferase [Aquisalinus flavus]